MNSFTLRAIGNLSRDPEPVIWGAKTFARFCLAGHDIEASNGGEPSRESATKIWFTAYGPVGEEIATKARKGDQLFVEAVAKTMMGSGSPYDHEFIVKGFMFGARKGQSGSPTTQAGNRPSVPPRPSAEEAIARSA
jgi:single-stranded DNA-binding protein